MNQDQRDELLIGMNREIGEINVDVKNIKSGIKWRMNTAIGIAIAAFTSWFR